MAATASSAACTSVPLGHGTLNAQQQHVVTFAKAGHNLAVMGPGGTGKSHAIMAIINSAGRDKEVVACAPTAAAAQNLGGFTVHSLFGLTPPRHAGETCPVTLRTWRLTATFVAADVIIMDEAWALDEYVFEAIVKRLYRARRHKQLIFVGDPYQTQPIKGGSCFRSKLFDKLFPPLTNRLMLSRQMRQSGDSPFASVLNKIRRGIVDGEVRTLLQSRVLPRTNNGTACIATLPADTTFIYGHNSDVDRYNATRLAEIQRPAFAWAAHDYVRTPADASFLRASKLAERLELKVGARVFLTRNYDTIEGLSNGTAGVVVAMRTKCELGIGSCADETCPWCTGLQPAAVPDDEQLMEFTDDSRMAKGVDYSDFYPVVRFNDKKEQTFIVMSCVNSFKIRIASEKAGGQQTPSAAAAVAAVAPDDDTTRAGKRGGLSSKKKASVPKRRVVEPVDPDLPSQSLLVALREGIPLALAYAITVHRAQGYTLNNVAIDLTKMFAPGMAYVGLSRVRRVEDLFITSAYVPYNLIKAPAEALAFEATFACASE